MKSGEARSNDKKRLHFNATYGTTVPPPHPHTHAHNSPHTHNINKYISNGLQRIKSSQSERKTFHHHYHNHHHFPLFWPLLPPPFFPPPSPRTTSGSVVPAGLITGGDAQTQLPTTIYVPRVCVDAQSPPTENAPSSLPPSLPPLTKPRMCSFVNHLKA